MRGTAGATVDELLATNAELEAALERSNQEYIAMTDRSATAYRQAMLLIDSRENQHQLHVSRLHEQHCQEYSDLFHEYMRERAESHRFREEQAQTIAVERASWHASAVNHFVQSERHRRHLFRARREAASKSAELEQLTTEMHIQKIFQRIAAEQDAARTVEEGMKTASLKLERDMLIDELRSVWETAGAAGQASGDNA